MKTVLMKFLPKLCIIPMLKEVKQEIDLNLKLPETNMNKTTLLSTIIFIFFVYGSAQATSHPHAYGGIPSDESFKDRNAYIMQFDSAHKTPRWVAYHVKPSYLDTPPRKGHIAPYFISGGDRDHDGTDAEDGDIDDAKTVHEIMYMSNMAPQHHNNFNGSGGFGTSLRPMSGKPCSEINRKKSG